MGVWLNYKNIKKLLKERGEVTIHPAPPTVGDGLDAGFSVGSRWTDSTTLIEYVCVDNTTGAAVWVDVLGGEGDFAVDGFIFKGADIAIVNADSGNDTTGSVGGGPFATIGAASVAADAAYQANNERLVLVYIQAVNSVYTVAVNSADTYPYIHYYAEPKAIMNGPNNGFGDTTHGAGDYYFHGKGEYYMDDGAANTVRFQANSKVWFSAAVVQSVCVTEDTTAGGDIRTWATWNIDKIYGGIHQSHPSKDLAVLNTYNKCEFMGGYVMNSWFMDDPTLVFNQCKFRQSPELYEPNTSDLLEAYFKDDTLALSRDLRSGNNGRGGAMSDYTGFATLQDAVDQSVIANSRVAAVEILVSNATGGVGRKCNLIFNQCVFYTEIDKGIGFKVDQNNNSLGGRIVLNDPLFVDSGFADTTAIVATKASTVTVPTDIIVEAPKYSTDNYRLSHTDVATAQPDIKFKNDSEGVLFESKSYDEVIYMDASAIANGDGSHGKPYDTWVDVFAAIEAAPAKDWLVRATGDDGDTELTVGTAITGSVTVIGDGLPTTTFPSLVFVGASTVTMASLTLESVTVYKPPQMAAATEFITTLVYIKCAFAGGNTGGEISYVTTLVMEDTFITDGGGPDTSAFEPPVDGVGDALVDNTLVKLGGSLALGGTNYYETIKVNNYTQEAEAGGQGNLQMSANSRVYLTQASCNNLIMDGNTTAAILIESTKAESVSITAGSSLLADGPIVPIVVTGAAPAAGDDELDGYQPGSLWYDNTGGSGAFNLHIAESVAAGAAVWRQVTIV